MSFWPLVGRPRGRCYRSPAPYRSYSRRRLIRSAPVSWASLARPGGNATGFTSAEYGIGAKWLELLKDIAPSVTRVAVLRDPVIPQGPGQWGAIQSVAPSFGVDLRPIDVRDGGDIERAIAAFARELNGGLIVTSSGLALVHRALIIMLAARHKLPAVYSNHLSVADGGLISYGPKFNPTLTGVRLATSIASSGARNRLTCRFQAPTKYELVINLKTAKALGIEGAIDAARRAPTR